ncbi:MAG: paraquat-inducible protein A [Vicinamibacterales bacterium]
MKLVIVLLTLINFGLLVPGVVQPIYSLDITSTVDAGIAQFEGQVYQRTRSILGAVRELFDSGNYLVSFLILLFSIIVPVSKGSMLLGSIYASQQRVRERLVKIVDLIGKWSMADVFVIGVFLAFLATENQVQENRFQVEALGAQLEVGIVTRVTSTLGPGFYFFLGYCIFSIFWTQVLKQRQMSQARVSAASAADGQ